MARTLITPQPLAPGGMWPTLGAAPAAGHMFDNSRPGLFLLVRNGHTAPITVTIPSTLVRDGLALASRTVSVPNATDRLIGPINPDLHNQLAGADIGRTYIDYSVVTNVTVALLSIG